MNPTTNSTTSTPSNSANSAVINTREALLAGKLVAVLRGDFRDRWVELSDVLIEHGINAIEVTLTCPDALSAIALLHKRYGDKALIGAGTVLTSEEVDQAVDAGARYLVAPNVNPVVIARCAERHALSIPGAYTPTEIEFAWRSGAGIVKVFPSMPIGPDYVRNIRGPLPTIPIICTGGITIENAAAFIQAGANAVGLTGTLVNDCDLAAPHGLDQLRDRTRTLVERVRGS